VRVTDVPAAAAHPVGPVYCAVTSGTVERVFEGDYAYFTHTGDGIGDPMRLLVRVLADRNCGARAPKTVPTPSTPNCRAYLPPIEENQ